MLLDVGTVPTEDAISNLLRGLNEKNVGGVTGMMSVDRDFQSQETDSHQQDNSGCFSRAY